MESANTPPSGSVNLPLSGPVTQAISPWMAYFPMFGSQVGSYTVNVGASADPTIEKAVLDDASYGRQLGRIGDALIVLLDHFQPTKPLSREEAEAIDELKKMLDRIANVKQRYHSKRVLRPRQPKRLARPRQP